MRLSQPRIPPLSLGVGLTLSLCLSLSCFVKCYGVDYGLWYVVCSLLNACPSSVMTSLSLLLLESHCGSLRNDFLRGERPRSCSKASPWKHQAALEMTGGHVVLKATSMLGSVKDGQLVAKARLFSPGTVLSVLVKYRWQETRSDILIKALGHACPLGPACPLGHVWRSCSLSCIFFLTRTWGFRLTYSRKISQERPGWNS